MNSNMMVNESYEKCCLGSMLLDNSIIGDVLMTTCAEAFYFGQNSKIFSAMADLYNQGKPVDYITVANKSKCDVVYISSLTNEIPSSSNGVFYADKINKLYMGRVAKQNLIQAANQINDENVTDIIGQIDGQLNSITNKNTVAKAIDQKALTMSVTEMMSEVLKTKPEYLGMVTGFKKFDNMLDGLPRGSLVSIGARPSIGKTAFATCLGMGLARQGYKGAIFEFEMTAQSLFLRELCVKTGIAPYYIKHGLALETQSMAQRLTAGMRELYELPLQYFDSTNSVNRLDWIENKIRQLAKEGVEFFIVDHIGLIKHQDKNMPRYQQVADITFTFQQLCRKYGITIIELTQLKRDAEGKKPTIADFRESGDIEQDSDVCIILHRDRAQSPDETMIETEVIIAKNRDGACGTINFDFFPKFTKFAESERTTEN